jgi:hypothetical protein
MQEPKEIKKYTAQDNVPFTVARKIFEWNKADNKWNIPIKNKKKIPNPSRKDAFLKTLSDSKSFRQRTQSFQNNRARLLAGQEVTFTSKRLDQEVVGKERNLHQLTSLSHMQKF